MSVFLTHFSKSLLYVFVFCLEGELPYTQSETQSTRTTPENPNPICSRALIIPRGTGFLFPPVLLAVVVLPCSGSIQLVTARACVQSEQTVNQISTYARTGWRGSNCGTGRSCCPIQPGSAAICFLFSFFSARETANRCMYGEKMLLARKDHGLARAQEPCHFTVLDSVYPCVGLGMSRVGACTLNEN